MKRTRWAAEAVSRHRRRLQRLCAVGVGLKVAACALLLGSATVYANDDAPCWQTVDRQTRLWRCHGQALPANLQAHNAARVQTLVVQSGATTWIIDPGATARQGRTLARALMQGRDAGAKSNWIVFNSRAQAEHVMASDALDQALPGRRRILALPQTRQLMQQRCVPCRARLVKELGPASVQGTQIRIPALLKPESIGPTDGDVRVVEALNAAIESDAWLHDAKHRWVWTGMLVDNAFPDLQAGNVFARIALLQTWSDWTDRYPQATWINSFGMMPATRIRDELNYFTGLVAAARPALEQGEDSLSVLNHLRTLPDLLQAGNSAHATLHDLNLQRVVRQVEDAMMNASLP